MVNDKIIDNLEDLSSGKYKVIQMIIRGEYRMFWARDDRPHALMLENILANAGLANTDEAAYTVAGMGLCRCTVGQSRRYRLWHLQFGGSSIVLNYRINHGHLKSYADSLQREGILLEKITAFEGQTFTRELDYININMVFKQQQAPVSDGKHGG